MNLVRRVPRLVARVPVGIHTKLLAAFLIIVGLLVTVGAVGLQVLQGNNRRAAEVRALQQQIAAYHEIRHDAASQLYRITSALASPSDQTLDAVLRQLDQFGYNFDRIQYLTQDEAETLERVRSSRDDFVRVVNDVVALLREGKLEASQQLQQTEMVQSADRLERHIRTLVNVAEANMVEHYGANRDAYSESQMIVVAFALGSTVLALGLGYALAGSLIDPVRAMARRMRGIATGDFTQHVTLPNRDELGAIGSDLNRMNDDLARLHRERERHVQFLRQTFGRYLSDDVATRLLDSPDGLEMGGEKRNVTLLLSDLRGFTTISEHLPPERVVALLNRYLSVMAEIILHHRGTINEFIGDAIFVIFGAPERAEDSAIRAVSCAVEMQLAMDSVNAENRLADLPEVEMGIGIHTGQVVVGNIGSDKRSKYGVVGRHVNLTSRIESCTVGNQILISDATRREVGDLVELGPPLQITAKGIEEPLVLWEVRGIAGERPRMLRETNEAPRRLPAPIPIRYIPLAGKPAEETPQEGRLVRLSPTSVEIESKRPLPPLTNIKIKLTDEKGSAAPGSVYGKVLAGDVSSPDGFLVRFTSVAPEAASLLERLFESCVAESEVSTTT